jgi:diaminohydroxyphosphoribosylaminopyrimidine deaminase/5-amino-6-(5-phosphoribosylamino)uracil reductase
LTRPHVTLKIATSMDGRIALANGVSQWITGSESRARVHQMRAEHDAVLVGVGTVLADDPLLTARTVPPPAKQPVRIVADSTLRTSSQSRLLNSQGLGKVVLASARSVSGYASESLSESPEIWVVPGTDGKVSPQALLDRCAVEGLHKIFLEGGGKLAASFIGAGLVDTIEWFRAPILIGGDGLPAVAALGLSEMKDAPRWRTAATARIGDDTLETYVRA